MDRGEDSYRRFLEGDDEGIAEIIRDYKDGLILYLNSYVMNIHTAEELAEKDANSIRDEEDLAASYIRNEERLMVRRCLARLKKEYGEGLYLTYFEGFSNGEAARIMKKNKHQISTLVYRAKNSPKKELVKEGFCYEER